jgi:hypothetical protein
VRLRNGVNADFGHIYLCLAKDRRSVNARALLYAAATGKRSRSVFARRGIILRYVEALSAANSNSSCDILHHESPLTTYGSIWACRTIPHQKALQCRIDPFIRQPHPSLARPDQLTFSRFMSTKVCPSAAKLSFALRWNAPCTDFAPANLATLIVSPEVDVWTLLSPSSDWR